MSLSTLVCVQGFQSARANTTIAICNKKSNLPQATQFEYQSFLGQANRFVIITDSADAAVKSCIKADLALPRETVQSAHLISEDQWRKFKRGVMLIGGEKLNLNASEFEAIYEDETVADGTPTNFEPAPKVATAPVVKHDHKSLATWLWQPELWQEVEPLLWKQLSEAAITRVYITTPIGGDNLPLNQDKLKRFIRQAHAKGISVWAVEGDSHAILADERNDYLRRTAAYNAYNQSAAPEEKLAGMQYDIEPYLIPGFDLSPQPGYQDYIYTVTQLKQHLQLPMAVVLPFWASTIKVDKQTLLLDKLTMIDELSIMNYRTESHLIRQSAKPFLAWGERHSKPVRIALEAGTLPDQVQYAFNRAKRGELWHIPVQGQHLMVLLSSSLQNPFGESLALNYKRHTDNSQVTFNHNIRKLVDMLPSLQEGFSRWSSYDGLDLHQYLEISRKHTPDSQ